MEGSSASAADDAPEDGRQDLAQQSDSLQMLIKAEGQVPFQHVLMWSTGEEERLNTSLASLPCLRKDMKRSDAQKTPITSVAPVGGPDLPPFSGACEVRDGVCTEEESDGGSLLPAPHPGLPSSPA
ncbi:uncharacterized protein FIESC28_05576 [Fusarium coffeatum]|uniref:Uncharacterized protein n=1 Tax=Fusarium coffeatum TaxID=231269 RepID=A0A366RSR0_9HYPO|nr:uncharacterized protein FIESC28_05576 [Fusarium coffeatum]RBR19466.1 hypothetical protein FIESC28_05576 [Fusarium coffeatum]